MIVLKTNIKDLFAGVEKKIMQQATQKIVDAMEYACLKTVQQAKSLDTYIDQSHNLRTSIGYGVYVNGQEVASYFEAVNGKGVNGAKTGKAIADKVGASWADAIVAVVVAGMDYAVAVESKGYDVISGPCASLGDMFRTNLKNAIDD